MTAARCPQCGSHNVSSDASNGGAGRNQCLICNHRAPVVEFHADPLNLPPGTRFKALGGDYSPAALIAHARRSILDDEPPSTPPAPIRQYRDE